MKRLAFAFAFAFALVPSLAALGCGGGTPTGSPDLAMASVADMALPIPPPLSIQSGGMAAPADESCLGARKDPPGPQVDTTIQGKITDFQDDNVVVGAVITLWVDAADVPDPKKAIATSMPSDMDGKYTIKIPAKDQAGKPVPYRLIMGNAGGMAISSGNPVATITTFEFNQKFDNAAPVAVKETTRAAINGLVSIMPDLELGVLAGAVRDCKNSETGGAQVRVTMTAPPPKTAQNMGMPPATYDSDGNTFYFVKVSGSTLPARTQKWTSADNGAFASLNVPPGLATVQARGVVGSGDVKLLSSFSVPVQAGAITIVELLPAAM